MCTPMIIAALFTIADFPGGLEGKVPACNVGDSGSAGRSPGEGDNNPCQYSYLENSMDRGAWPATPQGYYLLMGI